ncbi:MAG: D-glycero-beta-D-manno-heptose 1,7-bisphosphate 7-phosphatase [Desulfotignum sp.]
MTATVVFLDRDGVINQDSPEYVTDPSKFHFIPGSRRAVARLNRFGFDIIVITNQSIIGRNMATAQTLDRIFEKMHQGIVAAGGRILDVFFCPHTPDDGCDCRKPRPGLIFQAQARYDIDLAGSVFVGDSVKDMAAARNAGCGRTVLVATGNGKQAFQELSARGTPPDHFAENLMAAAHWITRQRGRPVP